MKNTTVNKPANVTLQRAGKGALRLGKKAITDYRIPLLAILLFVYLTAKRQTAMTQRTTCSRSSTIPFTNISVLNK